MLSRIKQLNQSYQENQKKINKDIIIKIQSIFKKLKKETIFSSEMTQFHEILQKIIFSSNPVLNYCYYSAEQFFQTNDNFEDFLTGQQQLQQDEQKQDKIKEPTYFQCSQIFNDVFQKLKGAYH